MVAIRIQATLSACDPVMRLVHRAPVMVRLDTTLRACASVMAEESIGAVLVQGSHGAAGVLSERDIVAAAAEGADLDYYRACDFMTPDIDRVDGGTTIRYAAEEMLGNEIRHLAVTDGRQTVGLISIRDLLAVLARS